MKGIRTVLLVVVIAASCAAGVLMAGGGETVASVAIAGDVASARALTAEGLANLDPDRIEWTHKGTSYQFTGVPLVKVLAHLGLQPGEKSERVAKRDKRSGYRHVVVLSAPDGFQSVFSYAELAETNGAPTKAYLVWELDGKPLPPDMGPFRVVATTDGEGARSIHNVARIEVVDMRRIVPPAVQP